MLSLKSVGTMLCAGSLAIMSAREAKTLTITGTVGATGKYLLTGGPVNTSANTVLKISFETTTAGDKLSLCAGTTADFVAGHCGTTLNGSGGPGFRFLTVVDAASLNGKQIYVIRNVDFAPASFSVTIE